MSSAIASGADRFSRVPFLPRPRLQALGQPLELGLLPGSREPAELVNALSVSDPDGRRFALVPAGEQQHAAPRSGGGDAAAAAMEE